MILILLIAVACIISFLDISDRFLDAETTNMLYCDDNDESAASDKETADVIQDEEEQQCATDTVQENACDEAFDALLNQSAQENEVQPKSSLSGALDSIKDTKSSAYEELDNLDDDEDDELPQSSSYLNKEEIDASVQAILESYNGGA